MTTEQIREYLTVNKHRLLKKYNLQKIGIFGSRARGDNHELSDVDIVVEFKENPGKLTSLKKDLRDELQSEFHISVDICREKYIRPTFKNRILTDAEFI